MAKETFKIIFLKDSDLGKAGTVKGGLTFDEQMDYMMENLIEKKEGLYRIESEQIAKPKTLTSEAGEKIKKTDTEKYRENLSDYMDSLGVSDMSSVKSGKKRICHNNQAGFYLKINEVEVGKNDEIHISMAFIMEKEKREIYKSLSAILLASFPGRIYSHNDMFDDSDINAMVEDLFKGKI